MCQCAVSSILLILLILGYVTPALSSFGSALAPLASLCFESSCHAMYLHGCIQEGRADGMVHTYSDKPGDTEADVH